MSAEFGRFVRIDTLGPGPRALSIEADEGERAALAKRFELVEIGRLAAEASLTRTGETIVATGRLEAEVVQSCVASGEPVPARIAEDFRIEFRPPPPPGSADEEVELGESELDVVFYGGAAIDLGEAVAETMSLALDPYPRSPAAEAALKAAGVKSEAQARAESSPFAVLKDKLGKADPS
ncbi:MAG: YceD family protein [Allosphingosinicella sp.]